MSNLEYLETLSNADLRAKCLEHGLPNVPVTNSSRKLLERRLRDAILGTENAKKAARRRTVHANDETRNNVVPARTTKSPGRVHNENTRRTIAAPAVVKTNSPKNSPIHLSRATLTTTTTTPMEIDYSEQNHVGRATDLSFASQPQPTQRDDPRLRRSVSLTKSGVMTTSYSQETVPLRTYVEENEPESDQEKFVYSFEKPKYSFLSNKRPDAHTLPSYEPIFEQRYANTRPNLTQSLLNSTSYSASDANIERTLPHNLNISTNAYKYGEYRAPNRNAAPLVNAMSSTRRTTTATAATTDIGFRSSIGNPAQISSSKPSLYPKLNDFYEPQQQPQQQQIYSDEVESSECEDEYDEEEEEQYNQPYVSNFTRNLEQRKSLATQNTSPQKRRTIVRQDDSVLEPLRDFFTALEEKYHLKQSFAIIAVIMLAIFLYVMFSP